MTDPFITALFALSRAEIGAIRKAGDRSPWPLLHLVPEDEDSTPYEIVTRLYGHTPLPANGRGNLGNLAWAMEQRSPAHSSERRFTALLNADGLDSVQHPLDWFVRMARVLKLHVPWSQLLHDLQRWESPGRPVQREWAQSFWGKQAAMDDPEWTLAEAVQHLNLGESYSKQLRAIAGTEKLPARKIGKSWLVHRSVVQHWLETKSAPGRPPSRTKVE